MRFHSAYVNRKSSANEQVQDFVEASGLTATRDASVYGSSGAFLAAATFALLERLRELLSDCRRITRAAHEMLQL
jgi:hypothetical protein